MRITNHITTGNSLHALQKSLRAMDDAQQRVTSGLRVEVASDDPSAASSIVSSGASLRAIDQYQRNINSASARIAVEEQSLNSLTQILERVKELAVSQGTSTASAQTRLIAKAEVDHLMQQALQLANQVHEGEFLFGGDQSNVAPLQTTTPPFTTTPPTGFRRAEISSGMYVRATHNATDVFLTTGVLAAIDQVSTALGNDDAPAIRQSIFALDAGHANVQVLIGESGTQAAQLEVATSNLRALDTSLRTFKSNLQEADLEKAVSDLVSRQTAYQAAMLATSRVMGMNLTEYLR
ncbi:MAG: hypothetical protein IT361_00095 [Gemmatimonadaceae bacterium]|nr:hypothetical protein [Gemmatimonadaceae bacterium]